VIGLLPGLGVGQRYFDPLAAELDGDIARPEVREALPVPVLAERFADGFPGRSLVVANSMGCQVAAEIAVRWPELVGGVVLVGPTFDPRAPSLARNAARLLVDSWYEPPRLTAIVVHDYFATGPVTALRQARHGLEHRMEEVLPRVAQAAVVVRGAHDPICSATWAREAASLLPRGRLVTIAGAAHGAHFSHAREVARVVEEMRAAPAAPAGLRGTSPSVPASE
jgi:pimeloyl-ACP methyl ester carboxylesterase